MGEGTPTHDNDGVEAAEEPMKRKADPGSESPEEKRARHESESDEEDRENEEENEESMEEADEDSSSSGSEESSIEEEENAEKNEKEKSPTREKGTPEKKAQRSPVRRERKSSPLQDRKTRDRKRSPQRRRRSPDNRRRSPRRSPIRRRSRSPRRDRRISRDRDRNGKERRSVEKDDREDGEVKDPTPPPPPPPKVPTKRELERMALLKKIEEEESLLDELEAKGIKDSDPLTRVCPYLDTIDRSVLDFDFEKLCSVSLSTMNVYACMVCGKYYQGRGTNTHAYTHSLDTDHRVFLNLQTLKFYCLPDNYEINDPSLEDIKYVLKPTFSKTLITSLDKQHKMSRAFDDSAYYPGIIGLNNIKANDYCNVILHAFSHVIPLRNYFLQEENYINLTRPPGDTLFELPKRFGELIRKLWNPRAFRKHVSPHEMLQAAVQCSQKKFQITQQSDAAEFMNFLLNTLHVALNGTQKTSSSIIYRTFRGRLRQYSRQIPPADCTEEQARAMLQLPSFRETIKDFPFLYLSLDLPPPPLYCDSQLEHVIPQVPLHVLLSKFNGSTEKEYKTYKDNIMKRFEILRLPEYLVVTYKRFTKNAFFMEKNPTIVNFPITNIDMYDCLASDVRAEHKYTTYDLIANVIHDGTYENGTYKVQILHQGSQKWFQMEDLHVEEILPQVIVLAESYFQIWRLNRKLTREQRVNEEVPDGLEPMQGMMMSNPFNPQLPPKVQ